jgi:hypothetical protein
MRTDPKASGIIPQRLSDEWAQKNPHLDNQARMKETTTQIDSPPYRQTRGYLILLLAEKRNQQALTSLIQPVS